MPMNGTLTLRSDVPRYGKTTRLSGNDDSAREFRCFKRVTLDTL